MLRAWNIVFLVLAALWRLQALVGVHGYIPATPANLSRFDNVSDGSWITLNSAPRFTFSAWSMKLVRSGPESNGWHKVSLLATFVMRCSLCLLSLALILQPPGRVHAVQRDWSGQSHKCVSARWLLAPALTQQCSAVPSAAPWIALVNCDRNATQDNSTQDIDIFTFARDRGASAAVSLPRDCLAVHQLVAAATD